MQGSDFAACAEEHAPSKAQPRAQDLIQARVLVAEDGLLMIVSELGTHACKRAASCLLRPQSGDLALAFLPRVKSENAYILAVLERADPDASLHIDLGPGARLATESGLLELSSGSDMHLRAENTLEATAQGMTFVSSWVRWLSHTFSLLGQTVEAVCAIWRESSKDRETTAETWTQRLGDCHRHVQDLDETQAGTSRTLARETALVHGRVTYLQAEEFVKADGQEVHLG
ncbi:MAG: DUF3540 domain-containing protein [Desulfovermiculus sp.]